MKPMALFILLCTNFTFPCFAITPMGTSTADFLITRNQLRSNALTYPIYYWVDAPNFPKTQDTLHIKLDSISLFEKTDPKARGGQCSGKERTLDLNKNSYYTSVMHIGGKPADTQIGTLKLIANSLSKVAQKLGVTLGKGHMTCAEIHFNYRNGDNTKIRKIRDKVITYSANSGATTKKIENAPIILGNIQTKATVITSANIRSNHLYLNKKAVIQFESGGKPIKRIIFKAGSLQKITVHNVGYGTLSALKFTCPDAFSRDFSYSCTQSLLSGKTCTISYRGRQNTPVGTGRLFINGDNGTQYHWLIAFTIQKPGQVQCWGRNTYGQLGNDSLKTHITPQNVAGLSPNTTRISAGMNDVCALNNHKVYCWGRNNDGQLGTGV